MLHVTTGMRLAPLEWISTIVVSILPVELRDFGN